MSTSVSAMPMSKTAQFLSKYKRHGYWGAVVLLAVISLTFYYTGDNTQNANWKAWFLPIIVFGLIPILDHLIGEDPTNYSEAEMQEMAHDKYYMLITLMVLPIYVVLLVWGMLVLANWESLSWWGMLGWMVSIGIYGGALGINTAHELIHKDTKLEQVSGGILLSMVCYAGFKIEHIYGHHVKVSTPEDASSARYNQSFYNFVGNAYKMNFLNAWRLQKERLQRRGLDFWSLKNELLWYYGLSLTLLLAFTLWQGLLGAVYFLTTSFVAFTLLEIINYIEHYGLHREKQENGRYEKVTPQHSWNSNFLLTNLILFHLQRHSDHHANANRRYQVLRNYDNIPQLPSGYAAMVVLALIPPLWKKVMNPRVEEYYQGRKDVLAASSQ